MDQAKNLSPIQSVLQIDPVVFDEISFHREGFRTNDPNIKTDLEISKKVTKLSDRKYRVTVLTTATRKSEYVAKVQISGFCSIDESLSNKDVLLNNNAVAILFAYIRSQLTLLTAQPETAPIVLPVMNIAKMLEGSIESE